MKIIYFLLFSFISSAQTILDSQINKFLTNIGRDILSRKTEQGFRFKPNSSIFYLTDQSELKIANVENYFLVGYPVFLFWPNSDFLYFVFSYYLANFNPYILDERSGFKYISDFKFLFDLDENFKLPAYGVYGWPFSKRDNLYIDIDELDAEVIAISERGMRSIFNFAEIFERNKKDKILETFLGFSKLDKNRSYGPEYLTNINISTNFTSNNFTRVHRFDLRYTADIDVYNKIRNLDDEHQFNIARAKILGLYTDKKEFLDKWEEGYFDHRLDNNLDLYKKYFNFYRYVKNRDWLNVFSLVQRDNVLFGEFLSFLNWKIVNQGSSNFDSSKIENPEKLKAISSEVYYSYVLKSKTATVVDLKNLKSDPNIDDNVKFYLLTQLYDLFPEYECDFYINSLKINFLFLEKYNDETFCELFEKAKSCHFSNFESIQLIKKISTSRICNN